MYMNIKDIIKDLDAVQMIELKNYLTDELSIYVVLKNQIL